MKDVSGVEGIHYSVADPGASTEMAYNNPLDASGEAILPDPWWYTMTCLAA